MGFLSSSVLWLRFALIRKLSVSQDNAPPLKTPLQPLGFPGPRSASGLEQGKCGFRSPGVWGEPRCGQSVLGEPSTAHKCIYAPLTLCGPEGQMAARRRKGGCSFSHLAQLWRDDRRGQTKATTHLLGPCDPPGP